MSDSESKSRSGVSKTHTTATKEQLYDYHQCISALEGRGVPQDLTSAAARCAVVRGLRCSYNFAMSATIRDMCASSLFPEFVRARNARIIMSNVVPDGLQNPEARPYCIWNPDFATEDAYRQLAIRYPFMRYQVGRACAAAGYISLYQELDLLPDVSIAEEARESHTEGGDHIYALIMSASIKYAVMDDYKRSINLDNPSNPAFLNGDTEVRWKLEWRYTLSQDATEELEAEEADIEEDRHIGLESGEPDQSRYDELNPQEATLLWEPLPLDLPTMKKNLLYQMAAFEGNVDRYARLINRQSQTELFKYGVEVLCVVRGIYHHTMFARWWQHQLDTGFFKDRIREEELREIQTAINARRIMINDIGTFTEDTPCKPWLIWYPLKPEEGTLYKLAKRCPSMHLQIAITAIYCNYKGLYEWIKITPHAAIMEAAEQVGDPFYREDLEKRAEGLGITDIWKEGNGNPWIESLNRIHGTLSRDLEPTGFGIYTRLHSEIMDPLDGGLDKKIFPYGGYFERYVWLSFETVRKMEIDIQVDGGEIVYNNDTRFYLTHEIIKDEDGNEVIEGSDVAD